jgi:hypothetical protein
MSVHEQTQPDFHGNGWATGPCPPEFRPQTCDRVSWPRSWRSFTCRVQIGHCRPVSRRNYVLQRESVAMDLRVEDTGLEGEIVCVDWNGHSQFNRLMYGYGTHKKSCRGGEEGLSEKGKLDLVLEL